MITKDPGNPSTTRVQPMPSEVTHASTTQLKHPMAWGNAASTSPYSAHQNQTCIASRLGCIMSCESKNSDLVTFDVSLGRWWEGKKRCIPKLFFNQTYKHNIIHVQWFGVILLACRTQTLVSIPVEASLPVLLSFHLSFLNKPPFFRVIF